MDELRRCDCGAYPVPVAMPYHERLVALECPHCGISTGYCVSAEQATASWNAGNVASYANPLFDLDDEPVQLTFSEEAVDLSREIERFAADLASLPERIAAGFENVNRAIREMCAGDDE